jgi:hypothetical protein
MTKVNYTGDKNSALLYKSKGKPEDRFFIIKLN